MWPFKFFIWENLWEESLLKWIFYLYFLFIFFGVIIFFCYLIFKKKLVFYQYLTSIRWEFIIKLQFSILLLIPILNISTFCRYFYKIKPLMKKDTVIWSIYHNLELYDNLNLPLYILAQMIIPLTSILLWVVIKRKVKSYSQKIYKSE